TVNGTGVGIGTTSPWAQLSIAGTSTPAFPLFAISTSTANSTSTAFIVDKNGWVGIGTTTPGSILAVQGIGNFTTGTSTFTSAGGINLTKGCYAIGGNCLPTTSSVYSSIASAYPFQLAGNATSTLTQFNGGLTSYASTTIGNGTATGGLTVSGNATTTGDAYFVSHVGIGTAITSSSNAQLDVKTTNNTAVHITTPDQSLMGVVINNATYSTNQLSGFGLYQSDTGFGTLLDNNSSGISLAPSGGVSIGSTYGNTDAGANNLIVSGNVGVGTSSPWRTLSVNGSSDLGTNALAGSFTATSTTASIFPYASTTALTVSGTNGLTLGSLNGPLQAVNGAVSASSTISVAYGGTGLSTSPTYGQILVGNSSGGYALTATSSLGLPNGTVTSIATNNGLTGGTITSSGTIGLNTANLAANILTYWDGSNLHATSSPTVGYLVATSSTATSTFAGGLSVAGTNGFTVLQNGNVGISTASPNYTLEVSGTASTTNLYDTNIWGSYANLGTTTALS
ncbi:MAG: hypothetical protein KGI66_05005, partial [Patescibacteria group bacterium]|nr:hypothetical protein [Patescibacteria group bacterium]